MEGLGKRYLEDEINQDGQDDDLHISEELVAWMTEPTPSTQTPRSDCG